MHKGSVITVTSPQMDNRRTIPRSTEWNGSFNDGKFSLIEMDLSCIIYIYIYKYFTIKHYNNSSKKLLLLKSEEPNPNNDSASLVIIDFTSLQGFKNQNQTPVISSGKIPDYSLNVWIGRNYVTEVK